MSTYTITDALTALQVGRTYIPRFKLSIPQGDVNYNVYMNHLYDKSCAKKSFSSILNGGIFLESETEAFADRVHCTIHTVLKTNSPVQMIAVISIKALEWLQSTEVSDDSFVALLHHPKSTQKAILLYKPKVVRTESQIESDDETSVSIEAHTHALVRTNTSESVTRSESEHSQIERSLENDLTVGKQFAFLLAKTCDLNYSGRSLRSNQTSFIIARGGDVLNADLRATQLNRGLRFGTSFSSALDVIRSFHRADERVKFANGEQHRCIYGECILNHIAHSNAMEHDVERNDNDRVIRFCDEFVSKHFVRPAFAESLVDFIKDAVEYGVQDVFFNETRKARYRTPPETLSPFRGSPSPTQSRGATPNVNTTSPTSRTRFSPTVPDNGDETSGTEPEDDTIFDT